MQTKQQISVKGARMLATVTLAVIALIPVSAGAKQIEYSTTDFPQLGQSMYQLGIISQGEHSVQGWMIMGDVRASIRYRASVTRLDTNALVNDGDVVPVGTRLRLTFDDHLYTDIDWSGLGGAQDSPYGNWRENATAPPRACDAADKINNTPYQAPTVWTVHYDNGSDYQFFYNNFVEFVISPPAKTIQPGSNLSSCSGLITNTDGTASMECTVSGAGAINPVFNYAETLGDFFYRIDILDGGGDWPEGCFGTASPLLKITSVGGFGLPTVYDFVMPAQAISFSFSAVQTAQPPAAPTVSGPANATCSAGVYPANSFTLTATDPNGDQIKYGVDWDNNSTVDQWLPSVGHVPSGTAQTVTRTWSTAGTYSFKVLAQDVGGGSSAWTTKTIVITACPPAAPTALLTANPTSVTSGTPSTLTWSCSGNSTSASIDQSIGSLTPSDGSWAGTPNSGTVSTGNLTSARTYTLTCTGPGGNTTEPASVGITPPVNGTCSTTHYTCSSGTSTSNVDGATSWTWTCLGSGGGTSASCSEEKPATAKPNLTPANNPVSGTAGSAVTLPATVVNEGLVSTAGFAASGNGGFENIIEIGTTAGSQTRGTHSIYVVNSPLAGNNASVNFSTTHTYTSPGTYYYRVCVDNNASWGSLIDESDEGNCSNWEEITIAPAAGPSVSCTDNDADNRVTVGSTVRFTANPSGAAAGPYEWTDALGNDLGTGLILDRVFTEENNNVGTRVEGSNTSLASCSAIDVVDPSACTPGDVLLTAAPDRVKKGATATLEWSIDGVETPTAEPECTITSSATGWKHDIEIPVGSCNATTEGNIATHAITGQTTFTLTCGDETAQTVVNIFPVLEEF